jgi:hypothetical protein
VPNRLSLYFLAPYLIALIIFPVNESNSGQWDIRGEAGIELRVFPQEPKFNNQDDTHFSPSIMIEPEILYEFNKGSDLFEFVPFFRFDLDDDNRTHFDIRELNWFHQGDNWSILVGADIVYWGVTESRHLVNIINQNDQVENIDEEDKLGQPMINFTYETGLGAFELFYLPFFRERTFPHDDTRLRGPFIINEDSTKYESDLEEFHQDFAIRWFNTVGDFDIGAAFFRGTSREPRLIPKINKNGNIILQPFYDIIDQQSIDIQWTKDAWLLKFEGITRGGHGDRFAAVVGGFEYTIFQILDSASDLGILSEYLYDGRDNSDAPPTVFDNDIFAGFRLALNDIQDTEFLAGIVTDTDNAEIFTFIETSRRFGENWVVEIEGRFFFNTEFQNIAEGISNDGFFTISLSRFF